MGELVAQSEVSKFEVPEKIHSLSKYDASVMREVIHQVATTHRTVTDICDSLGVPPTTVYWWRACSAEISSAWRSAMVARTYAMADSIDERGSALDKAADDGLTDPRELAVKIKHFDVRSRHKEWYMERINRRDFGNSIDVDSHVTVTAADVREQAWQQARSISDAEYSDLSSTPSMNQAVNE